MMANKQNKELDELREQYDRSVETMQNEVKKLDDTLPNVEDLKKTSQNIADVASRFSARTGALKKEGKIGNKIFSNITSSIGAWFKRQFDKLKTWFNSFGNKQKNKSVSTSNGNTPSVAVIPSNDKMMSQKSVNVANTARQQSSALKSSKLGAKLERRTKKLDQAEGASNNLANNGEKYAQAGNLVLVKNIYEHATAGVKPTGKSSWKAGVRKFFAGTTLDRTKYGTDVQYTQAVNDLVKQAAEKQSDWDDSLEKFTEQKLADANKVEENAKEVDPNAAPF